MSSTSDIEWTDATWNPVRGCVKVSPGCKHCYAETFAERFRGVKSHPYEQGFDLRLVPEKLMDPLRWKKPRRIFVNSMSDLFQDGVPDEYIDQVFAVMALCPQHTFQVLTKRAERMLAYTTAHDRGLHWLATIYRNHHGGAVDDCAYQERDANTWTCEGLGNVWLGVSVENQQYADERIPLLLQTPAAVRFLSCEPLLEGLDLAKHRPGPLGLDWVIVGGESGTGARPCDPWWIRNIIGQCRDAAIAVFVKQFGSRVITRNDDGWEGDTPKSWPMDTVYDEDLTGYRDGYQGAPVRVRLKDRKGGNMAEWPADLRMREYPEAR